MHYVLTEEGRNYLKNGLPEKRLAEMLVSGPRTLADVRRSMNDFSIALQWAKKHGWVRIEGEKLLLLHKPAKIQEQDALERIYKGDQVTESVLALLLSRNLVEKEHEDARQRSKHIEGTEVTNLTEDLIKTGAWKKVKLRSYNVEAVGKRIHIGKRQPYNKFLLEVRRKLVEMGFREMAGPAVELEFWNFDALYQAQNHPSRDWTETYSMKNPVYGRLPDARLVDAVRKTHESGWKTGSTGWQYSWDEQRAARLMPRAHDTAISPRTLSSPTLEIPGKYFQIVRCYRPDVIDATHGVEFNQMGGFVVAEDLDFRDLLGLLKQFAFELGGAEDVKFYADYYPFVEPGVQISAKHPELGWIELAGAGIFREELTKPLGVDAPVIAWGFGIDRLAMLKLGVQDIRYLFSQNLEWLRNAAVI